MKEKDIIDRLQMEALGVNVSPNGDNPKEETRKKGVMQIETINIDNDTSKIEKQLEGIKKELHTLNEILKHWSRR